MCLHSVDNGNVFRGRLCDGVLCGAVSEERELSDVTFCLIVAHMVAGWDC